jgi:ATP-dependent Clp protease adapter protein ClpS
MRSTFPFPIRAALSPLAEPEVAPPQIDEPDLDPQQDDGTGGGQGSDFRVILYNDDFHDVDEVIAQVMKATGCSPARATSITQEAHFKGRAVCFRGERPKCHQVCRVLREIQLQCEVDCD